MDWVAQLLGLDESWHNSSNVGGGVIMVRLLSNHVLLRLSVDNARARQGSASESCVTVCIAARERMLRLHPSTPFEELVIVGTTQTHSLGAKAALILGLKFEAIPTKAEDNWALRGEALRESLEKMKGEGKKPFVLRTLPTYTRRLMELTICCAHPQWQRWARRRLEPSTILLKLLKSVRELAGLTRVAKLIIWGSSCRLPGAVHSHRVSLASTYPPGLLLTQSPSRHSQRRLGWRLPCPPRAAGRMPPRRH